VFRTVLIANRGEIAVRIARTLRAMGIRSVAVHSTADRDSAHVAACDAAVELPGDAAGETYLRGDLIVAAALAEGAEAVIPGYGFLAENAAFAEDCEAAGLAFVGPTPGQMRDFGLKHAARALAERAGVPLVPGTGLLGGPEEAREAAARLGYPVMLKSTAGGGGIGLTRCADAAELDAAWEAVGRQATAFFGDGGVFLERCVDDARHVEVQIFGDGRGRVVALGERDCSLQRRNQKVVEETPAPGLPGAVRARLLEAAAALGRAVGYRSAGTVEFIYDRAREAFYFLEVNARLQVEHPVTEAVLGIDLVEWMIRTAAGDPPALDAVPVPRGAAIEVRLYAEDPAHGFQPSPGTLTEVAFPDDARVDGWVSTGTEVTPHYDPMLAKLIVHGADRAEAVARLRTALDATRLGGIATNLDYLRQVAASDFFAAGDVSTRALSRFDYRARAVEVIEGGTFTTVQDLGRFGHWDVGVPPSGPMDDLAHRIANRIVGNGEGAAALECTLAGPTLRFHADGLVALTGAPAPATLDGDAVAWWAPVPVRAGQVLAIGRATAGCRSYVAVRGGLDVPLYLGSRATFVLGQFGGHAGRVLRGGDMVPLGAAPEAGPAPAAAPAALVPDYPAEWEVGVLYGPHGAPDFFTEESIGAFFAASFEVHYNSNRLGIRLIGPKPSWARTDGGEAGLHPSNVHDCEYAIGSVNFTGDMPVILTRDGPSLGGFVCPVTIAKAELWKVGQAKPGDRIRFVPMAFDAALALERAQDAAVAGLAAPAPVDRPAPALAPAGTVSACVLAELPAEGDRPRVAYRQAGDRYVLIEYGPPVLDLRFRFRVHALMEALRADPVPGILELSPGVRSLQVNYDGRAIHQAALLEALVAREATLPPVASMRVRTRVVHLPMAFEDGATLAAVSRYAETVRAAAPWLPNNVDFMRRINGLPSRDAVRETVFAARYMVLGLGDVYLGAPCAVPVDPRHRLLTSKYNPARTFTAEGTVGIGGVYMCVYGMDSPGGYQLVGRTLPIWNKFLRNPVFAPGRPWLLRFFDQVRYHEVSEAELDRLRDDFRAGRATIRIEEEIFDLGAHEAFLAANAESIADFRARQAVAFEEEVARWKEEDVRPVAEEPPPPEEETAGRKVAADIHGSVWKVLVEEGQTVAAGDPVVILEAMKTELRVPAPVGGTIRSIRCRQGRAVVAGETLLVMEG